MAALILLAQRKPDVPPVEKTIHLTLVAPAPEPTPVPVLSQPAVVPAHAPSQPSSISPPPRRRALPKQAHVDTPPEAPAASPTPAAEPQHVDAAPVQPAQPAPPAVVGMSGIPTDYVNQVYARINAEATNHYPRAARVRQLQGRVRYTLTISPDGRLLDCRVQSSGEPVLDQAAEDAIRAAAPFPKLPDLGGTSYQLVGAISYLIAD